VLQTITAWEGGLSESLDSLASPETGLIEPASCCGGQLAEIELNKNPALLPPSNLQSTTII